MLKYYITVSPTGHKMSYTCVLLLCSLKPSSTIVHFKIFISGTVVTLTTLSYCLCFHNDKVYNLYQLFHEELVR